MLTVSANGSLRFHDGETGQPQGPALQACASLLDTVFSPDGRQVLSAADDGSVRLWAADSGTQVGRVLRLGGRATRARFTPDGQAIVTATVERGGAGMVQLWRHDTLAPIGPPMRQPAGVTQLRFDTTGLRLATLAEDRSLRVWDVAAGRELIDPIAHEKALDAVAFSPDGQRLATVAEDGTRVYSLHSGHRRRWRTRWGRGHRPRASRPTGRRCSWPSATRRGAASFRCSSEVP